MTLSIRLRTLRCNSEENEASASEEIYVLLTAVEFRRTLPGLPAVHNLRVHRYGVWEDFDAGETVLNLADPFWGLGGGPANIADLGDVALFASLMENDNGNPDTYRQFVETVASASLGGTIGEPNSRERAARLLKSIRDALNGVDLAIPFTLDDDHVGTEPVPLEPEDLIPAGFRDKLLRIRSGEGDYNLVFRITRSPFVVFGAIREHWEAQGAEGGPLGLPMGNEAPTFDGSGRAQPFASGIVSWHSETGAHTVWGLIGQRWLEIGREAFGYPVTDELPTVDGQGRSNVFRALQLPGKPEATIIWSPATGAAHEIFGAIRAKWAELGAEGGSLGYPVGAEADHAGGRRQLFQHGALFWTPAGGVVVQ